MLNVYTCIRSRVSLSRNSREILPKFLEKFEIFFLLKIYFYPDFVLYTNLFHLSRGFPTSIRRNLSGNCLFPILPHFYNSTSNDLWEELVAEISSFKKPPKITRHLHLIIYEVNIKLILLVET